MICIDPAQEDMMKKTRILYRSANPLVYNLGYVILHMIFRICVNTSMDLSK